MDKLKMWKSKDDVLKEIRKRKKVNENFLAAHVLILQRNI